MTYRKFALPLILCLFAPLLAGCPSPNQDAVLVTGAGALAASIFNIEGNPTAATQALKLSGQLATDVKNFVPSGSVADITQVGNDFITLVQSDTTSVAASEFATIVATILGVISDYNATPTTVAGAVDAIANAHAAVYTVPAPRTTAQFNASINAQLAAHPVPGLKPLK